MDPSSSSVSAITNHHNLDNLPDLIYRNLFKYLNVEEIFKLRLVSKKLYSIVNDYNIIELAFFSHGFFNRTYWFSTTRSFKLRNQLDKSKMPLLLANPPDNLLNLKYLKIVYKSSSFKLENINKFTKLQVLEISEMESFSDQVLLQLPDLKALYVGMGFATSFGTLVVDAVNLSSLYFSSYYDGDYDFDHIYDAYYDALAEFSGDEEDFEFNGFDQYDSSHLIDRLIKFKHPLSIKFLKLDSYDKNAPIFRNLECLECPGLYEENFKFSDLQTFKNLRKLKTSTGHNILNIRD